MAHTKMVFYPSLLLSLYLVVSRRDIREIGAPVLGGLAEAGPSGLFSYSLTFS